MRRINIEKVKFCYFYCCNYIKRYLEYKITQLDIKRNKKNDYAIDLQKCKKLASKKAKSIIETNQIISTKIKKGEPFFVGRYGGTEFNMMLSVISEKYIKPEVDKKICLDNLCMYSGFFPENIDMGKQFVDDMIQYSGEIDMLGSWNGHLFMEDYVISQFARNSILTRMTFLEPWYLFFQNVQSVKPWTNALEGKKVLVIHPFADTIEMQYTNYRKKIFENIDRNNLLLPEFELYTIKAIQTLGKTKDERFSTWFEALAWMIEECQKIEFDVAIIGCGAYGFPLAAHIKRMGKIAIHLGGATQLMFGIRGERWESSTEIKSIINEYWVRPSKNERIENAEEIEGACYW